MVRPDCRCSIAVGLLANRLAKLGFIRPKPIGVLGKVVFECRLRLVVVRRLKPRFRAQDQRPLGDRFASLIDAHRPISPGYVLQVRRVPILDSEQRRLGGSLGLCRVLPIRLDSYGSNNDSQRAVQ